MPTIELAWECVKRGGHLRVPVIVDVRDFWPEIFTERLPATLAHMGRAALFAYFRMRNSALRRATVVTSISEPALEWSIEVSGRRRSARDRAHVLAYQRDESRPSADLHSNGRFRDLTERYENIAAFVGTLSSRLDLFTCVEAARILENRAPGQFAFVFAGRGELEAAIRRDAFDKGLSNVFLPGWIDRADIRDLLSRSMAGLLPYPDTQDFSRSYPNKVAEYLCAGIPIVTSLGGLVGELLDRERAGYRYPPNNAMCLAETLRQAASDKAEWLATSARAREVFRREFDADRVYEAYCDMIESSAPGQALPG